jgi:phenylacetic acid degradation protein
MPIYEYEGLRPVIAPDAFVHPDAVLIGDVIIGARSYIGPGASLRGDMGRINIGAGANVQDNCVIHCFPGADTIVEDWGHIGHGAVLHGCHIGVNALVGMSAVVMDGAMIGENCIIGAMSFVKAKMQAPANSLLMGQPARVTRTLTEQEIAWKKRGTQEYQDLAQRSLLTLRACTPLTEIEPNRPRLAGGHKPLADTQR